MNKWSLFLLISLLPTTFRAMEDPNPPTSNQTSVTQPAAQWVNSFKCPDSDCIKPPMKFHELLAHMKLSHATRSNNTATCNLCKKNFSSDTMLNSTLQSHLTIHIILSIICIYCNKKFTNLNAYSKHCSQDHRHMATPQQLICPIGYCPAKPKHRHILAIHKALYHDTIDSALMNLSNNLTQPQNNTTLMISNSRKRKSTPIPQTYPYKCPAIGCNKIFISTIKYSIHIKEEHNGKPHQCTHENCKKSFKTKSGLKKHCKTYTGYSQLQNNTTTQETNLLDDENNNWEKYLEFPDPIANNNGNTIAPTPPQSIFADRPVSYQEEEEESQQRESLLQLLRILNPVPQEVAKDYRLFY